MAGYGGAGRLHYERRPAGKSNAPAELQTVLGILWQENARNLGPQLVGETVLRSALRHRKLADLRA
jgi:hypothetical protein